MGGIFGVASKNSCTLDLFFGVDYTPIWGLREAEWPYTAAEVLRVHHNNQKYPFRTKV